jgi:hypothetical protein
MEECECEECEGKNSVLEVFFNYADESKIDYDKKKLIKYIESFLHSYSITARHLLYGFIKIIRYIISCECDIDIKENNINNIDDNKLKYTEQIIYPVIREHLDGYYSNMDVIETSISQDITLNKQSKLEAIDEKTLEKLKLIKKCKKKHNCFCGDDDNKDNVINIPCCNKEVHYPCIEKWFNIKNSCPYCNTIQK